MATICDLPSELLQFILILLVNSSGGAEDFARVTSVSRRFQSFSEDAEIEKVFPFDNMSISNRYGFLQSNNFLFRCARRGNLSAQHLLSKILLKSASQIYVKRRKEKTELSSELRSAPPTCSRILDEDILATNFVARVLRDETFSRHWELVRNFLRRCSPGEFPEMGEHLKNYIRYFSRQEPFHYDHLDYCIEGMIMLGQDVADAVKVDLNVMDRILDEKYQALDILNNQWGKFFGESSFPMQITDYAAQVEAVTSDIDNLHSRMSTICYLGNIYGPGCEHDKDPAVYFEEGRSEVLLSFRYLFPEPV